MIDSFTIDAASENFKFLVSRKAHELNWPVAFTASLDLIPESGYEISASGDRAAGAVTYRIKKVDTND